MRFLSYNIRNALMREADKKNGWPYRREAVRKVIENANPDILALQEDSEEQCLDLVAALGHSHALHREPDFYEADSAYNAIFVRKMIEVRDSGAFWIAEKGKRSRLEGSICSRHASYVRVGTPGGSLTVVNVHLDHAEDSEFKMKEAAVFVDCFRDRCGISILGTVILGDFNATPDQPSHKFFTDVGFHDAADLRNNSEATFTGWREDPRHERIDYIWLSKDLEKSLQEYRITGMPKKQKDNTMIYPSDHCAVIAELKF